MVLMKFKDTSAARDYYDQYNGRQFSSMQPQDICRIVYIKAIQTTSTDVTWPFNSGAAKALMMEDIPTCPVCLERMDENVTALLTILCQHTFHCYCLVKWGDGR